MTKPTNTSQQESLPKRRSVWFWLAVAIAVLVLLPVLLLVGVLLLLRSETGTAWVIDQVPGLEVTEGRGSLFGEWQAQQLIWSGYGVRVEVQSPLVDWSPSCLANKQLCLDTLQADRLDVRLPASEEEQGSGQAIELPAINLPLELRIGDVGLGPLVVNESRIWDRLELAAAGSGADWRLERVFYQLDDYAVTVSGRVETRRDWPVDLQVTTTLPPPSGDAWELAVHLGGSVRDLRLKGESRGYLDAQLEGRVAPLQPALPARLKVMSERFLAMDSLPQTLALKDWFVDVEGSLDAGFQTRGEATLPGTEGPVALAIKGLVGTAAAKDIELRLSTGKQASASGGEVTVAGQVAWTDGLTADARVALNQFPWYWLIPDLAEPAVSLQALNGTLSWADGDYQANLAADVAGPQGQASLSVRVAGDLEQARLSELQVVTDAGSITGDGAINYAAGLSWQAGLQLEDFNPGYWVPALEASLSGKVSTRGALRQNQIPDIAAQWDLAGQWRTKPAEAKGQLDTASGAWKVSGLSLRVGDNFLEGRGTWGERLEGQLALSLPAPSDLLADLGGGLDGKLTLAGTPEDPQGQLTVNARALSWQDTIALARLDLNAGLAPGARLTARIDAQGLEASGQQLESVALIASGTRDRHRVALTAKHSEADLEVTFNGGFNETWQAWQGALTSGLVEIPEQSQRWQLESSASLDYQADGTLKFGAHCWLWQTSSLCAEQQTLLPTPQLAYRIKQFPTAALDPLLPETFRWQAEINGSVDLTLGDAGPQGRIELDAGAGEFRIMTDGDWQNLGHDTLTADLDLRPETARLLFELSGPQLGRLSVDAAIDPRSPERTLNGQFRLEELDIALAGIFAGLEEVAGEVNGQGRLSGPLLKPAITGEIALTKGRLVDPSLPVPMEEVVLSLDLKGYSAELNGRIQSNARSEINLGGTIDWEKQVSADITVAGERVPVNVEPYAQLELEPDLRIVFRDGGLSVSGEVAIPRGSIEVKGLPAQAVTVSEDEVIVGVEKEEPVVRSMNMDVTVVVGEDKVTFAAFGVTGNLEGTLRIGNDMDTRGTLRLVDGQYEAYGQELTLRKARLLFVGNLTQPYLDIEAVRTVDSVVAGIRLTGPVRSPSTEVFSNPSMPQTDALSYLILGRAPQSRGDEGQMGKAALSLGLTQANKFTGGIGEELGIRNFSLEAEGSGEQTSVVASGYVSEKLSVRYGVGIFEPISTVALRYDLSKRFYVEAASGLAASLDIFYTRDF